MKITNNGDRLDEADLIEYLQQTTLAFDLIVAADTFNYFGALKELLQQAANALQATGQWLFTLEINDDIKVLARNDGILTRGDAKEETARRKASNPGKFTP